MSDTVNVLGKRLCDICSSTTARYDGRTIFGPWANMCQACFDTNGIGLGTGKGQKLLYR